MQDLMENFRKDFQVASEISGDDIPLIEITESTKKDLRNLESLYKISRKAYQQGRNSGNYDIEKAATAFDSAVFKALNDVKKSLGEELEEPEREGLDEASKGDLKKLEALSKLSRKAYEKGRSSGIWEVEKAASAFDVAVLNAIKDMKKELGECSEEMTEEKMNEILEAEGKADGKMLKGMIKMMRKHDKSDEEIMKKLKGKASEDEIKSMLGEAKSKSGEKVGHFQTDTYGRSGYNVKYFNDKNDKVKAVFSGFTEKELNGEFVPKNQNRWRPEIMQEFRRRMEMTGDGKTRWNSKEIKTKMHESLKEAKDMSAKEMYDKLMGHFKRNKPGRHSGHAGEYYKELQKVKIDKLSDREEKMIKELWSMYGSKLESLDEDKDDKRASELIAMFDKKIGVDKAAKSSTKDVEIKGVSFTYGNREVSAYDDKLGKTFIWDVNNTSGRGDEYSLFDVIEENSISEEMDNIVEKLDEAKDSDEVKAGNVASEVLVHVNKMKFNRDKGDEKEAEKHKKEAHKAIDKIQKMKTDMVAPNFGVYKKDKKASLPLKKKDVVDMLMRKLGESKDVYGLEALAEKVSSQGENKFLTEK